MSIHHSLVLSENDKKQRSVLKRAERIRILMEKGNWKEGDNVFGLPKIKTIRIKIKKEKAEKAEAAATGAATGTAMPGTAAAATKEQPAAKSSASKGAATKGQDKK